MADKNAFEFTYSASERKEIETIRRKYSSEKPQSTSLEELRRLDRSTTRPGIAAGWAAGTAGVLIMGAGMSMSLVWTDTLFIAGIIIGIAGLALMLAAYPIFRCVTRRQRSKNAPKILELSERLLEENYMSSESEK